MHASLAPSRRSVPLRALTLLTVAALALAPGALVSPPASPPVPSLPVGATARIPADAVTGGVSFRRQLGRFGCLACAGVMIGIGGTSLVGLAVTAAAWPHYAAWCGLGCYQAFR